MIPGGRRYFLHQRSNPLLNSGRKNNRIESSEKTNRAVRIYLARIGGKKGDLSRFVNEAVRRRLFDLTVGQVKDRNAQYGQQEILDLIDEEIIAERADRP